MMMVFYLHYNNPSPETRFHEMGLLNYIYNLPDDTVKTRLKSDIVAAKEVFVLFLDILIVILIV